jgi:hypothetical protein
MKSSVFWNITSCSPLKVNRRSGETCRLHIQGRRISRVRELFERRRQAESRSQLRLPLAFTLFSCSAYSLILKMEAICFFETSVGFQQTTRCYIPEEIPVTGRGDPLGCEASRPPYFLDNLLTDGGEVVSLTRRPSFSPRKIPGSHFC